MKVHSMKASEELRKLLDRYVEETTYSFQDFDRLEVNTIGLEDETPLHMAVTRDALGDVRILIAGGANINAKTDIGSTPLHRAVMGGNFEITKVLLEAGADISPVDNYGGTALSIAKERALRSSEFKEILEMIEDYLARSVRKKSER
jgi:ankyrin repeat protein